MGAFGESMDFNPVTSTLGGESDSQFSVSSSRDDFFPQAGEKFEFDPGSSKLVRQGSTPETSLSIQATNVNISIGSININSTATCGFDKKKGDSSELVPQSNTQVQPELPSTDLVFDPALACLAEPPNTSPIEKKLRELPTTKTTYGFDKKEGGLTTRISGCETPSRKTSKTKAPTTHRRPVMVDMNRRGTGGFF